MLVRDIHRFTEIRLSWFDTVIVTWNIQYMVTYGMVSMGPVEICGEFATKSLL